MASASDLFAAIARWAEAELDDVREEGDVLFGEDGKARAVGEWLVQAPPAVVEAITSDETIEGADRILDLIRFGPGDLVMGGATAVIDAAAGDGSGQAQDDDEDGEGDDRASRVATANARFRQIEQGQITAIRQARREAQEAALEAATARQGTLSNSLGLSADLVSRTDRFFVRTPDGHVVGQDGIPITEARMQDLLRERGLVEGISTEDQVENARHQIIRELGQRREILGGGLPTQGFSRENLGGFASADRLAERGNARGVQTDSEGNVVMDINGQAMPGSDAMVPQNYQAYSVADAARPAREMSAEEIGMLQAELVRSGYLSGNFVYGRWDASSQDAYQSILTYANVNGINERQAFTEAKELFSDDIKQRVQDYRTQVEETAARPLNMSSVREDVRSFFSKYLNGRVPSTSEMEGWAVEMSNLWQEQARQEREAKLSETQIDPRADIPEEFGGPPAGAEEVGLAPDEPIVDVQSQFAEQFRDVYAKEIGSLASREENQRTQGLIASIGSGLISRAGGR